MTVNAGLRIVGIVLLLVALVTAIVQNINRPAAATCQAALFWSPAGYV